MVWSGRLGWAGAGDVCTWVYGHELQGHHFGMAAGGTETKRIPCQSLPLLWLGCTHAGGPHVFMDFELPPGSLPRSILAAGADQSSHSGGSDPEHAEQVWVQAEVVQGDEERPVRLTLSPAAPAAEPEAQQGASGQAQHPAPVALVTIPVVKAEQAPSCPPLSLLTSLRPGVALPMPIHSMSEHALAPPPHQLAAAGPVPHGAAVGVPLRLASGAAAAPSAALAQPAVEGLAPAAPSRGNAAEAAAAAAAEGAAEGHAPAEGPAAKAGGEAAAEAEAMEVDGEGVRGCGGLRAESPASWISGGWQCDSLYLKWVIMRFPGSQVGVMRFPGSQVGCHGIPWISGG
jgi:hypothetical protein